ncbi:MAG: R3H domain-containing nucleic acid-binding protein [bacterium]|nr:R3H domain-containing nucleic acid-binding protein [bacterium]
MNNIEAVKNIIKQLLELGGFNDFSIEADVEGKRISIFIHDFDIKELLPKIILDFERIAKLALKKIDPASVENLVLDMNNYRREREHIISELAKAAARKVLMNKQEVQLPAMNAYERRIVHMELASRPDVKTESSGLGPERHIVVKPI